MLKVEEVEETREGERKGVRGKTGWEATIMLCCRGPRTPGLRTKSNSDSSVGCYGYHSATLRIEEIDS